MTPIHLLEASGATAFTLQQWGWITVHKRLFFLKERLGAVYITVKLGLWSPELNFSLFCDILGAWTWTEYALKSQAALYTAI